MRLHPRPRSQRSPDVLDRFGEKGREIRKKGRGKGKGKGQEKGGWIEGGKNQS